MDSIKSTWPVHLLPWIPYTYKQDYLVVEYEFSAADESLTRNTLMYYSCYNQVLQFVLI